MNYTPLTNAVENNSKEMIEILISKGAEVNLIDNYYCNIVIFFIINSI